MQYLWFPVFPNFNKVAKFAAFIERPKVNRASASGRGGLPVEPAVR